MYEPTQSARGQLLSVLRTAKNGLEFLTQNDWALIIDRAKRLTFKKDEKLIVQGSQTKVLYVLAAGKVDIALSDRRIARIGPGEICGDMAFLENSVASATANAEEAVEVYALEWAILEDLFELYPHLASRFYRSLAVNLSRFGIRSPQSEAKGYKRLILSRTLATFTFREPSFGPSLGSRTSARTISR
jgi:CRP-like cAMP-binding protein